MKKIKFTPPFRVGKKEGRAVLDSNGYEVVIFRNEDYALKFCQFINACADPGKHIEKIYKELKLPELDKHDKKIPKFTYYDLIDFGEKVL